MVNDINTLNGALSELGETMADNLVSMGVVDASASDGLTTLAGKILDIEPSIGGLDLDTAVTISSSESSISLGSSIVLTSKLTASYDDETIVDVDLSGVLQNATLLFKNGNTTIGTAVTDVNGVATFTYTPPSVGTLSLKTIFAGTDNFNNCESSFINVTVVAPSYDDIVLTADDSILSYYDGDSTTLRAQLMDGSSTASVSGVTVEFFNGSTSMGTSQTDSNGVAVKTYTSTGAGDVSLKAEADNGMLVSEICSVEDCILYDDFTTDKGIVNWSSNATYSYSSSGVTYKTTADASNPLDIVVPTNCEISSKVQFKADSGQVPTLHNFWIYRNGAELCIVDLDNSNAWNNRTRITRTLSNNTWYNFRVTFENGVANWYLDDTQLMTKTVTNPQSVTRANFQSNNNNVLVTNVKVKSL